MVAVSSPCREAALFHTMQLRRFVLLVLRTPTLLLPTMLQLIMRPYCASAPMPSLWAMRLLYNVALDCSITADEQVLLLMLQVWALVPLRSNAAPLSACLEVIVVFLSVPPFSMTTILPPRVE